MHAIRRALRMPAPRTEQHELMQPTSQTIRIYSMASCPYAQRTRILLRMKQVPHDIFEIDLTRPRTPEFLALNPSGKVPVIIHDGRSLFESSIINEYLEDVFPQPPVFPKDPYQRALARIYVNYCNVAFSPNMYRLLMEQDPHKRLKAEQNAVRDWRWLEEQLKRTTTSGHYALDRFGIVEATYAPFLQRYLLNEYFWNFVIPKELDRVRSWRDAVLQDGHVVATSLTGEDYIKLYADYSLGYGVGKIPPGRARSALDLDVPLADRPLPPRRVSCE